MEIGEAIIVILKSYWDILFALILLIVFITKLKTSLDFMKNRIDYEISRLREYVDLKNDTLSEKIGDVKRSIDAVGIMLNETANFNREELRQISQRMDKFFDSRA